MKCIFCDRQIPPPPRKPLWRVVLDMGVKDPPRIQCPPSDAEACFRAFYPRFNDGAQPTDEQVAKATAALRRFA